MFVQIYNIITTKVLMLIFFGKGVEPLLFFIRLSQQNILFHMYNNKNDNIIIL